MYQGRVELKPPNCEFAHSSHHAQSIAEQEINLLSHPSPHTPHSDGHSRSRIGGLGLRKGLAFIAGVGANMGNAGVGVTSGTLIGIGFLGGLIQS